MAASTALGGVAHLLDAYVRSGFHHLAWSINGISVALAEIGAISLVGSRWGQQALVAFAVARYVAMVYLVMVTGRFLWVGLHAGIGFLAVISTIHIAHSIRTGNRTYLRVPLAAVVMLIPAATHALNVSLSAAIDKNVVSHVLLVPGLWLLGSAFRTEEAGASVRWRQNRHAMLLSCTSMSGSTSSLESVPTQRSIPTRKPS